MTLFETSPSIPIPGLNHVRSYVSQKDQKKLESHIDSQPWREDLQRRVQHYGYRYDYKRKSVDRRMRLGPLPEWTTDLTERLQEDFTDRSLNQMIVNEYTPGQGIAPHIDCLPCFTDTIISLSLASSCVLTMSRTEERVSFPVLLEPGDLLVLEGEARYRWKHGIAPRKTDRFQGLTIRRQRRISLTFRTVIET